jgi:hypothetical protein
VPVSPTALGGGVAAALFGIYADLAYNAYGATNSSPQTTELFAGDRADTLWKYVRMGGVQVIAIGLFGTVVARSLWPLLGALVVGVVMTGLYAHAMKAGGGQPQATLSLVS